MWETKRGGILYSILILILCSSVLVRNHRLFRSHLYLERGIYSMDLRVQVFGRELEDMETYLQSQYGTVDELMAYLRLGRKISYKDFTILHDSSYNGFNINMVHIIDKRISYQRRVMVVEEGGLIRLLQRGV